MRNLFVAIFATLMLGTLSEAYATESACARECSVGPQHRQGTTVQLICIDFRQQVPGPVRLTIYRPGKQPAVVEADFGTTGDFCRGRHFFRTATRVELCNPDITRAIEGDRVRELLRPHGRRTHPLQADPVQLWR